MTRDQVTRYAHALSAADDPNGVMDAATAIFRDMTAAEKRGDHAAVRNAAIVIGDACLRLCVTPAASAKAAGNKVRFLAVVIKWAWPREPALAAVLEAARRFEEAIWGAEIEI